MNSIGIRAFARAAGIAAITILPATGAFAQQVVSAVESERVSGSGVQRKVSTTAGRAVATTYGGVDTRAQTSFGVNKIHVAGNASYEQYATSAWLDSYTVGGSSNSMVNLRFTINFHGSTNIDAPGHPYNFKFYALRGDNWTMSGAAPTSYEHEFSPTNRGDQYDTLLLTQTRADGGLSQLDARDFTGVNNYLPNGGGFGSFFSGNTYDAAGDVYTRNTLSNGNTITEKFYADRYQRFTNGNLNFTIPYNSPSGAGPLQGRRNLEAQYQVLGVTTFCSFADDECGSLSTGASGTDLTLEFSLAGGSTFSLAGYLFADDFTTGTANFYNTVKLTGIEVSDGASLSAASGTLVDQGNGQFGYQAVINGAVPEPGTWALLILGFGVVGAGLRGRRTSMAFAG